MMHLVKQKRNHSERGQSLVEVALFFPIFIILLAGLVEVSQLLVTQNRVNSAARAGTRFASNGGQDEGIVTVIMNNITQTLETDDTVWDIWSIRATVDSTGAGFNPANGGAWQFIQIYGISTTVRAPSVDPMAIQARVLDEIQRDEFDNQSTDASGAGIAAGLQIVGTYAIHDVDSILGLDAMSQLAGFSSLDAISIMRITTNAQNVTSGCAAFPLAVSDEVRAIGAGSDPYPSNFDYPSSPPLLATFTNHAENTPILSASEGIVYYFDAADFDWLVWNEGLTADETTLANSLGWPGDSTNYDPCPTCSGGAVAGSGYGTAVRGYIEPGDPTDESLHELDLVNISNGSLGDTAVSSIIDQHIDLERTLRVLVWTENTGTQVRINENQSFAVMRIIGYNATENWIVTEFIRWDDSCGKLN